MSASHLFHAGTWVTRLLAKDADDPTTPNAMLVYRLGEQKPTSAFVVNSLTGDVTSLTWLDREVGIHYFLPLLFELQIIEILAISQISLGTRTGGNVRTLLYELQECIEILEK